MKDQTEIKPIYSDEAEQAVLGAVLINQDVFKTLDLDADDFYVIRHREIWRAFQELALSGSLIDVLTVGEKLGEENAGLLKFVTHVPSSMHAEYYADIVREKSRRRDIVNLASEMVKSAYKQESNLDDDIPEYMTRLVSSARMDAGAGHISVALSELYEEVQVRMKDPLEVWGIPTGFIEYDLMTGGHHPGEVTLLAGKPGLGKSIIAMQMAVGMASHSPGAIYEMEMGQTQTVRRSVSNKSRIETRKMRNGKVKDNELDKILGAIGEMENLPIFISDFTGWTTASMRADLARLKAQHNIQWFIVDYLYLLQDRYGGDDHERLAYISKALKIICKDLDLAGLVIHSMTKSEMNSDNPSLAGMRGSGQIAYDADVAIYLLEDPLDKDGVKLYFVKFREDIPDRYVRLKKDTGFPAFKNIIRDDKPTYRLPYRD